MRGIAALNRLAKHLCSEEYWDYKVVEKELKALEIIRKCAIVMDKEIIIIKPYKTSTKQQYNLLKEVLTNEK